MQTENKGNLIIMRLFPGERVLEALETACKRFDVKTGVVVSGIGQVHHIKLGYFKEKGNYTPQTLTAPYELLGLSGVVSKNKIQGYDFHLHAVLGAEDKQALGGHLIAAEVKITAEIALLKTDIKASRKINPETGLEDLVLGPKARAY